MKAANSAAAANGIASVPVLIATNVTGSWLFVGAYVVVLVVTLVAITAWAAHTRSAGIWQTAWSIMRAPRK